MDKRRYFNKMDKRNYEIKRLKINAEAGLRGYSKGSIVKIEVDKNGNPVEDYWARRLYDSKYDNCVSFVERKSSDKIIDQENKKEKSKKKKDKKE